MCEINDSQSAPNALMNANQVQSTTRARPLIDYVNLQFWYNKPERVTRPSIKMTKELISFGCTDIKPEVLRELLRRYDASFSVEKEVTIQ